MNRDSIRITDSELTRNFLQYVGNFSIVVNLVKEFDIAMHLGVLGPNPGSLFYLKGGNAISYLTGAEATGDYDFQFVPPANVYNNWVILFPAIDAAIRNALQQAIHTVRSQPGVNTFNDAYFTVQNLQEWADTPGNPMHDNHVVVRGLQQGAIRNNIQRVGHNFMPQTYQDIVNNPIFNREQQRIIDPNGLAVQTFNFNIPIDATLGPGIYVNYTIPDFILYRMVYSYRYRQGDDNFYLKSEIIDVSVPRPGSAERYISQNRVVTNFRAVPAPATYHFLLPGWGYHFFENISLLQEIELGVSGSKHKKAKRVRRLQQAIDVLLPLNNHELYSVTLMEPPFPSLPLQGFWGAFMYNIHDYTAAYNLGIIAFLRNRMLIQLEARLMYARSCWRSNYPLTSQLVDFNINPNHDKGAHKVMFAKNCFGNFIRAYNNEQPEPLQLIKNQTYSFISPLIELDDKKYMPCNYVVITVTNAVFNQVQLFTIRRAENQKSDYNQVPGAFMIRENSCVTFAATSLNIVVQNSGAALPMPPQTHIFDILQRSILTSQRLVLADYIHGAHVAGIPYKKMASAFTMTIQELYHQLKAKIQECRLADIFPDLPDYEDVLDSVNYQDAQEPVIQKFLSELVLCKMALPAGPTDNKISFFAELKTVPRFLNASPCYEYIKDYKTIECCFTEVCKNEFVFTGSYRNLANCSLLFTSLKLPVSTLSFCSGTTSEMGVTPEFLYDCKLTDEIPLLAVQHAGKNRFEITGKLKSNGKNSIDKILSLFGLEDVQFQKLLPADIGASLFEQITLKEVSISANNKKILTFSAEVEATKSLSLVENKISFLPRLFIDIQSNEGRYSINLNAYGQLDMGETSYDIYANPIFGKLSFGMREGQTLDLAAVSEKFFSTAVLPKLKFDKLSASINYYTSNYQFDIQTFDLLEFEVVTKKISIDSVALKVWYESQSYAVTVSGKFNLLGLAVELGGTYYGNSEYSFSACVANDITFKASDLLKDYLGCGSLLDTSFDFNISQIAFRYNQRKNLSFDFEVYGGFCGSDPTLKKLFAILTEVKVTASKEESHWGYKVQIACALLIGDTQRLTCSYDYDSIGTKKNEIKITYKPVTESDVITFRDILKAIGLDGIDDSWNFITEIGVTEANLNYNFVEKEFSGTINVTGNGSLEFSAKFGKQTEYSVILSSGLVLKMSDVPLVGGLVSKYASPSKEFTIKNLKMLALSNPDKDKDIPAGVQLRLMVLGEEKKWQIRTPKQEEVALVAAGSTGPKVFWIDLEKTLAIFTLHRLGLGLDGSYLMLELDASLNVSPLTFSLYGAGIGLSLSNYDLKYYLSGFGASFKNQVLTIDGAFRKDGDKYAGKLLIQVKQISVFAVAEYSESGSLFAYAIVSGRIGGPPPFFVTGLALGFGYNRQILIPSIEKVADYPLIKGALGKIDQSQLLSELSNVMKEEEGQSFLAAGVKFTTFEIANSFALFLVSFGNNFEINMLGISDITMPPNCPQGVTPVAHAQLALKAAFKPADGFFGIEGRLTSESYILSKDCHLKGGFAFYMWFDGPHSGDFVMTFGGYHPKYQLTKPSHYPDVPSIGFDWRVDSHVNISGEVYFALTPSAIMAGGRLKATGNWGNFKAWFTAKADFLIVWKPFHYDIEIEITLGASYHVDLWLVSFTISAELGVGLHIWGPDFSGTAYVDLGIVSFDVSFGANASKKVEPLSWNGFCESFLPKPQTTAGSLPDSGVSQGSAAPLVISLGDGVSDEVTVGGKKYKAVRPGGLTMTVDSVVPIKTASVNQNNVPFTPVDVCVKPMGGSGGSLESGLIVTVSDVQFEAQVITKNLPTALWGGEGELRQNVPCGILLKACEKHEHEIIFPVIHFISLEDLYLRGATVIKNAFIYLNPTNLPTYTDKNTISVFSSTVNTASVASARESFLKSLGVTLTKKIDLSKYAEHAENYLDEEVLIPVK